MNSTSVFSGGSEDACRSSLHLPSATASGLALCWERNAGGLIPTDRRLLVQLLLPHFEVWPDTQCIMHLLGDALGQGWFLLPCYSQRSLINTTGSAPLPVRAAAAVRLLGPTWGMERVRRCMVRAELGSKGHRHCSLCPQSSPALCCWVIC